MREKAIDIRQEARKQVLDAIDEILSGEINASVLSINDFNSLQIEKNTYVRLRKTMRFMSRRIEMLTEDLKEARERNGKG